MKSIPLFDIKEILFSVYANECYHNCLICFRLQRYKILYQASESFKNFRKLHRWKQL